MPHIHLFNPMRNSAGSEFRTYELYRLLRPHAEVTVWSQYIPDPQMAALLPIRPINARTLRLPWSGTLVLVGAYYRYGRWLHLSRPGRIVLVYNTYDPELLEQAMARVGAYRRTPVEVVFASAWLRATTGLSGPVQPSPVDLSRFRPAGQPREGGPFTVGRLSRDVPQKHHPGDLAFYTRLADAGMAVRVLGGTVLAPTVGAGGERGPGEVAAARFERTGDRGSLGRFDTRIALLPHGAEDAASFLQGLDCFFYRTHDDFREPHGRVVQEAMASGLPVVCRRGAGYDEYLTHGEDGFLFDTEAEAMDILETLRRDSALRRRVGAAARRTVERIFSHEALNEIVAFYLRPHGARKA